MKWSFASVGVIVAGLVGIVIIMLFEQITTTNESDYYLLKEITEASMIDSIDISYYRETGNLKIVKEKFVENFTRRFAESTLLTGTGYIINFYDIMEIPPKATISIETSLGNYSIYGDSSDYKVNNTLTGILEYIGKNTDVTPSSPFYNNPYSKKNYIKNYYSMPEIINKIAEVKEPINIPEELNKPNIDNIKIDSISYQSVVENQSELLFAELNREIDWSKAKNTNYNDSINDFAKSLTMRQLDYYNCNSKEGNQTRKLDGVDCNTYKYYIYWQGTTTENESKIAVKLNIKWSYDEYEYAN